MTTLNYEYLDEDINDNINDNINVVYTELDLNLINYEGVNSTNLQLFDSNHVDILKEIKLIHKSIKNMLTSNNISTIDEYLNEINNNQSRTIISNELDENIETILMNDTENKEVNEKQTDVCKLTPKYNFENLEKLLDKFKIDYKQIQDRFLEAKTKFKKEIELNKGDILITKQLLDHANKVNKRYDSRESDELLQNIKKLSNSILNNSKLKEIKNEYITIKDELDSFLTIVKKINGFNLGSMCICCLSNPVTMCFNPCGHTICETCLDSVRGNNYEFECIVCRSKVNNTIKIFFS